jgi:hypothetical protein
MVNGRQTRNLPGRKTDMQDCQWGATLHAHGLRRAGFAPPAQLRKLQDYPRLRADRSTCAASCVQHMQKALERMNVKLHDVIGSRTGASGLAVVRAILGGERSPERLLLLCESKIKRTTAARVKESLVGAFAEERLFALTQALAGWEHDRRQIADCDHALAAPLRDTPGPGSPPPPSPRTATPGERRSANAPETTDLRGILAQMCGGEDLTVLPAHTEYSVLQILSEVGTDLTKWRTEKHCTAWTGLAPGSRHSGKRKGAVTRGRNRTGRLFCVIARSLARGKDIALGASTGAWPPAAAVWLPTSPWRASSPCSSGASWSRAWITSSRVWPGTKPRCSRPNSARSGALPSNSDNSWCPFQGRRRKGVVHGKA